MDTRNRAKAKAKKRLESAGTQDMVRDKYPQHGQKTETRMGTWLGTLGMRGAPCLITETNDQHGRVGLGTLISDGARIENSELTCIFFF